MDFNGQKIRELRQKGGLTQEALAQKLGSNMRKQHIYAYEKGLCAPRALTVAKMAEVFKVESRVFFT